ncbi:MAG: UDP-N-acetylmuramoyl-L-alanyl-D-glutamate--2,6-diaminopimelate ligase [Saprospirales bacterium]|nr:MAG: UDP-N-acetylmuramoyl-L-alanyl-D-glutamate--2,6-diaminopimelate ligase [Saprospirales bacterium]
MKVRDLLKKVRPVVVSGNREVEVKNLYIDSRSVGPGDCFVAIEGSKVDGHEFIDQALKNGAKAVVAQREVSLPEDVTLFKVKSSRKAWAEMACNLYENPSREINLIGVTGTNGKTTVATLLHNLFTELGYRCGLISTNRNLIGNEEDAATHTTPDPRELNGLLRRMVESGCEYAFMEVSSHALDQERTFGVRFAGAIFTNLSHDHLDYHGDFKSYLYAKKKLFDDLEPDAFALTNVDDRNGNVMLQNCRAKKVSYGLYRNADYKAKVVENSIEGLQLEINGHSIHFLLTGAYNAYNLLGVYASGIMMGFEEMELLTAMSALKAPEGRLERVHKLSGKPAVFVDYAHSPDALEKVLSALAGMKRMDQKLFVVFGCGGDRDVSKRPEMGRIASRIADEVIITSDNPRTEDPVAIIEDVAAGVESVEVFKVRKISSRQEAIKVACQLAGKDDIVLVAGKGHEKYQDINGEKVPFDDKEVARKAVISRAE